jgi:hypothetical protein
MSIHECGRLAAMASSAFARVLFTTRLATLLAVLSSFAGLLLAPSSTWAAPSIGTVQLDADEHRLGRSDDRSRHRRDQRSGRSCRAPSTCSA